MGLVAFLDPSIRPAQAIRPAVSASPAYLNPFPAISLMDPAQAVAARLLSGRSGTVLDAGAGAGELSAELKKMGFTVTSCDLCPEGFSGGACEKVDLNKPLPFSKPFDTIACMEVIEHLENPYHLIREFARLTKKGSLLILSTPNIASVFSRIKFLLTGEFFLFSPAERQSGHIRPLAFWEVKEILEKNSFRLKEIHTNNYLKLCGIETGIVRKKRAMTKLVSFLLSPLLKPKNREILQGDSLIYVAERV